MRSRILLFLGSVFLFAAGYFSGNHANVAHAAAPIHGSIPKKYGHLAAAIADEIGTGLIFEDDDGVVRFVAVTGRKEGELKRY